jgi:type IV secretion system protein VirB5
MLTLIANVALAIGMVKITEMRKETPFVIAVDKWGYTVPIGKATPVTLETYTQFHIKEFIRLARSVSIDTYALEANIKRAYTLVKKPSQAFNYLGSYYNEDQKPFEKAKQYSVFVEDISLIKVSEHTFRARWSETTRTLSGHALSKDNFWGEFTYRIHPVEKQDPSERDANPLSLKIEKLDWARE